MANYVLLSRLSTGGIRALSAEPDRWREVRERVLQWETRILHEFTLLGDYDHCLIFQAPDNLRAYRAMFEQELLDVAEAELLPAVDLPLFQRLISQTTETEGPHHWQIRWWARAARLIMYWYASGRIAHKYCKPLHVTGAEVFKQLDGPCIITPNHTSHMDGPVMNAALPMRVLLNSYGGAAADRWFLKGRREWTLQPWYMSMINGSWPIKRGGGSATLDYGKWLIDQGCNLIIFPEGTRSGSRKLGKFRHGVSILALEKKVPVVQLYMTGLAAMRPKGSRVITPGPAGAHFLKPIYFPEGTTVPEATRMQFGQMNAVHTRVLTYGPEGAYLSEEELAARYPDAA